MWGLPKETIMAFTIVLSINALARELSAYILSA